jgi:hypothetical protein
MLYAALTFKNFKAAMGMGRINIVIISIYPSLGSIQECGTNSSSSTCVIASTLSS